MDPLSITASVIAVATLAAKLCATFSSLREVCNVLPGRLHALNNEIVDFEAVCRQVGSALDERAAAELDAATDAAIRRLLQQARQTLVEVHAVLAAIVATSHRNRVAGVRAWKKEHARLEQLQNEIKTVKSSLNILIGTSQSYVPGRSPASVFWAR
ncbi:uncharacterized protein BDR25DRAFT_247686 [Lindgomyces ingoldianus]|uniref:Uncharacterized protein n=1 Tax=Lindgomyces ingoldianus TaxID=673940 RepID=A0ACB6Q8X6_9PLEO|nr:uncharacterized protein BDR25DRAFT_247686 [Lindgomyces ingoldianus]KAF2462807.1 hypothetical protein BDR25DRAFT_247686 [Lindgomyces ingoldianus]